MDDETTSDGCRNWLELPPEITASILSRLGAVTIFTVAEKVCKSWRAICKDPLTWRTIDLRNDRRHDPDKMCRAAVDRSCVQLVDISIRGFGSDELLHYITDRSDGIRRLRLVRCVNITNDAVIKVLPKLSNLEELELSFCFVTYTALEVIGRSCPRLKSLKLNNRDDGVPWPKCNKDAHAVAASMRGLEHLQLFGNDLTNEGVIAILNGCPRLESLDLRHCWNLDTDGSLGERLRAKIKFLRLPNDSTEDYEFRNFR